METTYETKRVKIACTIEREMRKAHPNNILKPLKRRIKALESATQIRDLLDGVGNWHPLTARGDAVYAANLSANYRLVVHFRDDEGSITAHVLSIEDYH